TVGFDAGSLPECLFDYQAAVVKWALKKGRAAIFAGTGLGKTLMELAWANAIYEKTGYNVLILAPLSVAQQIEREADRFGLHGKYAKDQQGFLPVTITNYEKLHKFDLSKYKAVVLDESSILKSFDGKTRDMLIDAFSQYPYRLAATATPAPNDFMELGNHAQFLGVMNYTEMLAMFFTHDGGETQKWRLKGHAKNDFWSWMAQWAVMFNSPHDLGFDGSKHVLPAKHEKNIVVESNMATDDGSLFRIEASTLQERIKERRNSLDVRCEAAAEIANKSKEPFILWCNLNAEGDLLEKLIPDAEQISGAKDEDEKEAIMFRFLSGETRVLVSKPSLSGFGMNMQHCNNQIFVGLNDSWEQVYQAVRRCWRFGQTKEVNIYYISAQLEGNVVKNLERKNKQAEEMMKAMINEMKDFTKQEITQTSAQKAEYKESKVEGKRFTAYLGDCVDVVKSLPEESIDYSIYSPPFASLYTYSNSDRDMGNCKDHDEFFNHYLFLVKELYRVIRSGRLVSFHCMNLPTSKSRDGHIGLRDFRGELIRAHEAAGFWYHSEVAIWKDPVTAMQRTKALGLLHKTIRKDSAMCRQGIPDYLVTMRKPGDNTKPISHTKDEFPVEVWQKYASPIWMDINPSDTLQYRSAREHDDERHICPLQLEVIRRGMDLWTAPDDVVMSPFMGIASEGHVALQMGRKFIGAELKESYFNQAVKNLQAVDVVAQYNIFSKIA
ncbi:MAG: DEAD/DEAH box helicase, partial [Candidatus Micrarchaeota archaeon]|nr:DEAD/DEAH box helicase [Candidatus Micrarchaeota archaeon]